MLSACDSDLKSLPKLPSTASADFSVGRTTVEWTDTKRNELCSDPPNAPGRRLKAYLWYPAEPLPNAKKAPLLSSKQVAFLANAQDIPAATLQKISSESYEDAPISLKKSTYPVLMMSHGAGGGSPEQHASTAEAMAAKGYVVVGLFHPYQSLATFFDNGDVVTLNPACDPLGAKPEITETSTYSDYEKNWQYSVKLSEYFAADFASALSQLDVMNAENGKFARRLELTKVGVFGHSFGGSNSFNAARIMPRVVAVANIDGTGFSTTYANGIDLGKSLLTIISGEISNASKSSQVAELQAKGFTLDEATIVATRGRPELAYAASRSAYLLTMPTAKHLNFSDQGLWASVGVPTDANSINLPEAREILNVQNQVLNDFFGKHLLGNNVKLNVPATTLKGIRLESR
jgi:dienelactone hydrolase